MTRATRSRLAVFTALALVMAATRLHHFGIVPDASWAVFFAAGFWLRDSLRWAFPALMAVAVLVDWAVIGSAGIPFWSHYCVSPGYWFLIPAHFSLWAAGSYVRRHAEPLRWRTAMIALPAVVASATVCHFLAQGGFYWLSSVVAEPTVAGWAANFGHWYPHYLGVTVAYVGIAAMVHVAAMKLLPRGVAETAAR
ncbi:hypothetical protein [Arenimonas composti]|uniref:Cobalamin ABC transporter n=1 Tax=Arenimonas composti TR7-09 = DSM 18010 TaxID=1121013 RepID=A0A091B9F8_9GAMM|nr:hypothetical protein [Arenimonas composti]KFN49298.1 hypothetical protein P873_11675 [Arenimonas composti TR7-09 = DSM 18010]